MSERIENEVTNVMPTTGHAAFGRELSQPIEDQKTERAHTAYHKVQASNQKNKSSKRIILTPLSLLVLAACGGGGSEGTDDGDGPDDGLISLFGRVVKGPLENAFVFADINGNGSFDLGEPSSTTDSDGRFTLEGAGSANIIATTSANTIDQSSGVALEGLTLSAPAGATVVTPLTSIIAQSGGALTPTQVAQILGLPAGFDPLAYDPYAQGTDTAEAARVEVIAQQLIATVRSFAAIAEGTGVTEDEALSAAFSAVVQIVVSKGADGATDLIDFTSAEDIGAISQAVAGNLLALDEQGDRDLNINLFDNLAEDASSALINVNDVIDTTVTQIVETGGSLSSGEVRNALSTTQVLQQQLEAASQSEAESPGSGSQSIVFSDIASVLDAVQNAIPNSLSLDNTLVVENAANLFVGTLSVEDDQNISDLTFSIVKTGLHWQYFEIANGNELHLKAPSDFEAISEFSITIDVTDSGGKSLRKTFTISVQDGNDAPTGTVTITGTATQGEVLTADTSTLADADGLGAFSYQWKANGTNISGAIAKTFTLTQAEVGKVITADVHYTDGGSTVETVQSNATSAVQNVNDAPVGVADTLSATEDTAVTYTAASLLGNDADADGNTLSIKSVTAITGGTAVLNGNGTVTFTPTANFNGAASFSYIATDGTADTAATTVTVNVGAVNDAPVGGADTLAATEDTAVTYTAASLLGNDTDADGNTLSIKSVTAGTGGTVLLNQDGTVTFTPTANFNGAASFSYIATDGTADTAATTVTVNVGAVNDAPTNITLSANSVIENDYGVEIGTLAANDVDDQDVLTFSVVGQHSNLFEVSNNNTLKLKDDVFLDYESKNSYDITITVNDGTITTPASQKIIVNNIYAPQAANYLDKGTVYYSNFLLPPQSIEPILTGGRWTPLGLGKDMSYSFGQYQYYRNDYDYDGYSTSVDINDITKTLLVASDAFKGEVAKAFALFSNVSLLTFSEVTESASSNGNIRLAVFNPSLAYNGAPSAPISNSSAVITTDTNATGSFANIPWSDTYNVGDVFFSGEEFLYAQNYSTKPFYFQTIAHEIGHALGLSHPHQTIGNYSSDTQNVTMPDTIMAYADYDGDSPYELTTILQSKPTTLMVTDIEAIQYLYGANEQHEIGDNIYTVSSFSSYDWIYATIWDAGGNDTISWADQSTEATIDLRGGAYSFFGKIESQSDPDLESAFGPGDGILGIAKNVIMENAIGGSNRDIIIGNEYDNYIYGGPGAGVADVLIGGAGADVFVCMSADSTLDLNLADIILDFQDGIDKIGLEEKSISELGWADEGTGTVIYESSSSNILFYLSSVSSSSIGADDFLYTNFV
jgi:YD repeat-containing protein